MKYSLKALFGPEIHVPKGKSVIVARYDKEWELPLSPDDAYRFAVEATYFWKEDFRSGLLELGGPEQLLAFLAKKTGKEYRWPEIYRGHFKFVKWRLYMCEPIRELLRRHFDQDARIYDIDLVIE